MDVEWKQTLPLGHLIADCSASSEVVLTNAEMLDWLYFSYVETIKIPDKLRSSALASLPKSSLIYNKTISG